MSAARLLYALGSHGLTAENKQDLLEDVEATVKSLVEVFKDSRRGARFAEDFVACLLELPHKTYVYALLFASVFDQSKECAEKLLEALDSRLSTERGSLVYWRSLKMVARFYAELVKLGVCSTSVLTEQVYKPLLDVLSEPGAREARRDCAAHIILASLPWSASIMDHSDLTQLFTIVRNYIEVERTSRQKSAEACNVFRTNCPYDQKDELALLLDQNQDLATMGWKTPLIPDVTELNSTSLTTQCSPSAIVFPADGPNVHYPLPMVHFEILSDAIVTKRMTFKADIPPATSIDTFVARDILQDLIFYFDLNHHEFVKLYFETTILPSTSPYNLHQILLEVLFGNMLRLPQPEHKFVYYGLLVVDLCTAKPKDIAPILGKVIYTVFERVQDMDVECQFRLSSWFSYHLSNFDYKWKWAAWSSTKEDPRDTPKSLLIQETLEKCVRLSYFERVTRAFGNDPASDMTPLMPPQPRPLFKYDSKEQRKRDQGTADSSMELDEASTYEQDPRVKAFADRFLECLRLKQSIPELQEVLQEIATYGATSPALDVKKHGDGDMEGMALAREIMIQCMLFMGSKSFSHTLNVIERFLELIKWATPTPEAKLHLVMVTASFWQKNKQFFMIVLDKMVNYHIVEPSTIVEWVFHSDGGFKDFSRSYIWTILKSAISKVNARAHRASRKLELAKVAAVDTMDTSEENGDQEPSEDVKMGSPVKETPNANGTDSEEKTKPLFKTAMDAIPKSPSADSLQDMSQLQGDLDDLQREKKQIFIDVFTKLIKLLAPAVGQPAEEEAWFRCGEGMLRELGRYFHAELKPITTTLDMLVFMSNGIKIDKTADVLNLSLDGKRA